jgi:Pyridoxamine 5'-phosphate oxidase
MSQRETAVDSTVADSAQGSGRHHERIAIITQPAGQPSACSFENSSPPSENTCDAVAIIRSYRTCEFANVSRDGTPQTWPVSPLLLGDGQFLLCTNVGYPQKVFNIRRNPKVSLFFSDPIGSGLPNPGGVLICGDAFAENRVIADIRSLPELADLTRTVIERQPSSKLMSSFIGRRLFPSYYWRLAIYVTPVKAFFWPTRDFTVPPQPLDLEELRHVAAGR